MTAERRTVCKAQHDKLPAGSLPGSFTIPAGYCSNIMKTLNDVFTVVTMFTNPHSQVGIMRLQRRVVGDGQYSGAADVNVDGRQAWVGVDDCGRIGEQMSKGVSQLP